MKTIAIMTACLAAGLVSAGASAQTAEQNVSVAVSYADLDLNGSAGQATLARRVHRAALQLCRDSTSWDPMRPLLVSRCLADAKRQAQSQIATAIAGVRPREYGTRLSAR
jgi:UrcA family protein